MTKYLLKSSPKNEQKQDSDLSSNGIAFQNLIHEINDDLVVHKKGFSDDTITWKLQSISTRRHRYLLICQVIRQAS